MVNFVRGGCTGVHQPCDVGIQRPLKLSTGKSYHETIVNGLLTEFDKGNTAPDLKDTLRVLRDRSVRWMWNAYKALSNKELVKKVCFISQSEPNLTFRRHLNNVSFMNGIYR
jgi:hypothetical protein